MGNGSLLDPLINGFEFGISHHHKHQYCIEYFLIINTVYNSMKLNRLKSIANNAIRDSIWTPELIGYEPFSTIRPTDIIVVD